MGRRVLTGAVLALAMALGGPVASGQASVVIGSALGHTPNLSPNITGGATYMQLSLPDGEAAPEGLTSPVTGTVVNYRLMNGGSSQPVALRVIRPLDTSDSLFTGAGTSVPQLPAQVGLNIVPVTLPIGIGDRVGINCCAGSSNNITFRPAGMHPPIGATRAWTPIGTLQDGGPGVAPDNVDSDLQLMLAAEIEPTNTFTIKSVVQRKGRRVIIALEVPNAGTVDAGPPASRAFAAKKKARKPQVFVNTASGESNAAGTEVLVLKTTKTARARLAQRGKLKVGLRISFTPRFAATSVQSANVTLKKPGKPRPKPQA